jgi:predicted dehydrogenase
MNASPVRIAVLGAGLIGKAHIRRILEEPGAILHAIVDPSEAGKAFASGMNVPWFESFAAMLHTGKPDGVIVATPNQMHVANGLEIIAAGLPVLIEKPIADDIAAGLAMVEAAEKAGVPVLTGHHRRHNPMIQRAKAIVESGKLGHIVSVHAFFWLMKPDDYFDVQWRRELGAGPVMLNMAHDFDLLRYLCGEVAAVQAFQSNAVRGHAVDESTVVSVRFVNGALGTINVSDTIVAPWSWEHTTGENVAYPRTDQPCYMIGGTHGSLSVPRLELWSNEQKRSWWEPFRMERLVASDQDPLSLQIKQFCKVIRGEEKPLVSGREGVMTLKVIDAVRQAAHSGNTIRLA